MWILSALGPLSEVRAGADGLDGQDPALAQAVSWFEDSPGRFRLLIYVADEASGAAAQALLAGFAPSLHARLEPVPQADWVAMALDGLPAVQAGRFLVAGAHALASAPTHVIPVWIEASEAFGTGHHGTTMGCLRALEERLRRGRKPRRVLDVGAGSGVLAIAAAKLGARALAVEIDPHAGAIAEENVLKNGVRALVRVEIGDAAKAARRSPGGYDLVFANVLLRPLLAMAKPIAAALRPGGVLILSGILTRQEPRIRLAYQARGLRLVRRLRIEGWSTCVFERPRLHTKRKLGKGR